MEGRRSEDWAVSGEKDPRSPLLPAQPLTSAAPPSLSKATPRHQLWGKFFARLSAAAPSFLLGPSRPALMLSQYGHRALGALMLLGTASGLVAVLASMLLFQIQGGAVGNRDLTQRLRALLRPISAGLASLGLVLSLSCLLLSLLHGYCGAERCAASGGGLGSERWVCGGVSLLRRAPKRHKVPSPRSGVAEAFPEGGIFRIGFQGGGGT